jgi:hypothetical protein
MKQILKIVIWGGMIIALVLMVMGYIDFAGGGKVFGLSHSSTFYTLTNTVLLWVVIAKMFHSDFNAQSG